jgi:hypothetical protein
LAILYQKSNPRIKGCFGIVLCLIWICVGVVFGLLWGYFGVVWGCSGKVSGVVLGLLQGFFFEPFEPMSKLGTKET